MNYKLIILIGVFFILFFFTFCKKNQNNSEAELTGDQSIDTTLFKHLFSSNLILDSAQFNSDESSKSTENERKADSIFVSKVKKELDKSIHKEKSCMDILKEFKSLVYEVIESKDPSVFKKKGWNKNDPIFQKCLQSNDDFKLEYYNLNNLMKDKLVKK